MTTRRKRSDSMTLQGEALRAAGVGVTVPAHVKLRKGDQPFWDAIVRARLANEWASADLVHAGNLARCMADVERTQGLLDTEGDTLTNVRGTVVMNPRHVLLEILSRRAMALTRLLQLHAAPKMGDTRDQAARKAEAMRANDTMDALADDDLLAKPTVQ